MKITEDKEFGDVFAGEERGIPTTRYPEKNTSEEERVVKAIDRHVIGGKEFVGIQRPEASKLIQLLKRREYSDFIVPPTAPQVYRGMGITKEVLAKMLRTTNENWVEAMELREGKLEGLSLRFIPKEPNSGSSWTIDFNTAFDFAKFVNKSEVILILTATTSANKSKFFDLAHWYDEVDDERQDEKEVVGLGTIIINKIEWLIR